MIVIRKKIIIISIVIISIGYMSSKILIGKRTYEARQVSANIDNEKVIVVDARTWWRRWRSSI